MAEGSGFLPPEPPGDEPDLGAQPPRPPAPPPEQPQWQPPQQQPGWQQPQPGWQQPPQQPSWQQAPPPGYWQPQQWQQPGPQEPDNGPAVAGFVMALIGAGLLVLSFGLLAFVSLVLAIFALVYSRRGKRKVAVGETSKHKGLAQAGFVTSIVTLVIAGPVTLLEIVFLIAYATDEGFREDFQDEWDEEFNSSSLDEQSFAVVLRLSAPILRAVIGLIA